ncbi:class I SAM-dependent methyltransferase [Parenemella sanctibonifatiensis]|uniref:SAM-dependent methyltransferase n=1 Tax=Parenemella sanctibonifatiensis TaxID=2016505 RepID=A0A255EGW3_9ACTN|nr:methyltransferase [Parenemella sanctibonifatiensis]OYN88845.1 SAM-dependent methyltransferase [Parenemella sanctibonifatiensis]
MDPVIELLLLEAAETGVRAERTLAIDLGHPDATELAGVRRWSDRAGEPGAVGLLTASVLSNIDLVLLRLPGSLAELDEYAWRVATLAPQARLLAGGRVKHMRPSMNTVLATHFTEVSASLGRRHARVLRAAGARPGPGWPRTADVRTAAGPLSLVCHGAVFGWTLAQRGRVDAGTDLMLQHLPETLAGPTLDLGSGAGVLSIAAVARGATVTAVDSSAAATASTRASVAATIDADSPLTALQLDAAAGVPTDQPWQQILCNPPFHQGVRKDSTPAQDMLSAAAAQLAPGGELWVVYNAHLPYLPLLRRFGATDIVTRDRHYILTRTRA